MRGLKTSTTIIGCMVAASVLAAAQPSSGGSQTPQPPTEEKAAPAGSETGLRFNFRGVPLDMVLEYLSEAAGFIIIKETEVKGKVDAWSNQPLTREEAVDLLNTILNKNDYAAIRNGRTLTIVARDEAKKRDIPVKKGGDADAIPKTDAMVTQVLPVQYANVTQLMNNLQPLIGTYATMTANESANTLILTATQADVKRMTEIVNALDESISSTSVIHVYSLRYADAKELATVIKELFAPTQQQSGNNNNNNRGPGGGNFPFGGNFGAGGPFGGQGGGNRGGGNAAGGRGGSGGNAVSARVVAVADERSNSLVVAAPEGVISSITELVTKIDNEVLDVTELRVFPLVNADPVEMADLLTSLFPDETTSNNNNAEQSRFRFGPFGGGGAGGGGGRGQGGNNNNAGASDRAKKKGRVIAVSDQRTSSLIVSAASELMPQIEQMVRQLDRSSARKQKVYVYSLENADVQQVEQVLRGMFERTSTTSQNSRNNQNQTSPLSSRSSNTQGTTINNGAFGSSGFGNSNGGFGGGGLGGN